MAYEGPTSGVINIIPRTSSGSGVYVPVTPSNDIGGDGDFAFDQNTNTLYGPKDSTQSNPWPVSGLSIGNGRYTWRGSWSSSNSYNAGDITHYNGEQFICIKTIDYGSPAAWAAQDYTAGTYVTYSGTLYVCVVDVVSTDVPGVSGNWKQGNPGIDASNYAYAAQGNFQRLAVSLEADTFFTTTNGTTRLNIPRRVLLNGAYPVAPSGVQSGVTFPNYLVDSESVDSSSSLQLSTTSFSTPGVGDTGPGATVEIKDAGVTTAKIADRNVTNAKLDNTTGSQAVSTGVIRDAAVTTAKLADSSVTSAKIVNGTIATADIANGAITQPLLGTEAVGEGNISQYLTTSTNSPSAYLPATKLVSAGTTVSGTAISTTNPALDAASAMVERSNGMWLYPWNVSGSGVQAAASARFTRFRANRPLTIKTVAFVITGASTNAETIQVGLYSSSGTQLVSSGNATLYTTAGGSTTTTTTSTGVKYAVLNGSTGYTLTAGTDYYVAFSYTFTSGTGITFGQSSSASALMYQVFGATVGTIDAAVQSTSTLPSTMASVGGTAIQPTFGLLTV